MLFCIVLNPMSKSIENKNIGNSQENTVSQPISLAILEKFSAVPASIHKEITRWTSSFIENSPERFDRALFIGRFQPLHAGHMSQILIASHIAKKVIIGIGSANMKNTDDNPLSAQTRELLIQRALAPYPHLRTTISIIHINDFIGDDNQWLEETKVKAGKIDVVVGNNSWVNGLLRTIGVPSIEIEFERTLYEGRKIRAALRSEGWDLCQIAT